FYRDFTAIWGREWPELVTETLVWEQLALADGQIPCRWNRELTGNSGGAVGGPRFQASIARAGTEQVKDFMVGSLHGGEISNWKFGILPPSLAQEDFHPKFPPAIFFGGDFADDSWP